MLAEVCFVVVQESVAGVYHRGTLLAVPQVPADAGKHHEVVASPVQDARLVHLFQVVPRQSGGVCLHAEGLRRLLQFEEGCPLMTTSRQPLHGGGTEVLAVVPANDAEASRTAIGTVMLFVEVVFMHDK